MRRSCLPARAALLVLVVVSAQAAPWDPVKATTDEALGQCKSNPRLQKALVQYAAASNSLLPARKRWIVYSCNCRVEPQAHNTEDGFHACSSQFQSAQRKNLYTPLKRPGCSCGGLGDRYNGVISGLVLAMLTGRAFAIDWASPCALEGHLPTGLIRWDDRDLWQRIEQDLDKEEGTVATGCLSLIDYPPDAHFFRKQNITHTIRDHRVVRFLSNVNMLQPLSESEIHGEHMRLLGLSGESVFTRNFACLFAFLFGSKEHTSPLVNAEISRLLGSPATETRTPIVGLQIRLGGVWDTSLMEVAGNENAWLGTVDAVLGTYGMSEARIFVTSDRESAVVPLLRQRYGEKRIIHNQPAEVNIHLDHVDDRESGSTGCGSGSAITKAFVDHHILSHHCDILIISMSGFGATAVWRSKHNHTFVVGAKTQGDGLPLLRYSWAQDDQNRIAIGDDGRRVVNNSAVATAN